MSLTQYKGKNWEYNNITNSEVYGHYSNLRIAPEENLNATLQNNTQTKFRFDIPISSKAIRMNSIKLYMDFTFTRTANLANTSAHLFLPSLGCIERAELKTKTGQVIYRNDKCRSYLSTLPDRIPHNQKKGLQFNRIFYRKDYVDWNSSEFLCYGNINNLHEKGTEIYATKFQTIEITASNNYGEILNLNGAGAAFEQNGVAWIKRIKWTQSLSDVLGGPFSLDLDVVIPDDQLILT